MKTRMVSVCVSYTHTALMFGTSNSCHCGMRNRPSPPVLCLFCFWLWMIAFLFSWESSRCCMHKTSRMCHKGSRLLQPCTDVGEDISSITAERWDGWAGVCCIFFRNYCYRFALLPLSTASLRSSAPLGDWLMWPRGMFQSPDRDFRLSLNVEALARNSKCQASPKPLLLSSGWEQYVQASLGGIAALVYYSRGAKLATAGGCFDDLPGRIPIQRHRYSSFWSSWRFH